MAIRKRNSKADQDFIAAHQRDLRIDHETGLLLWSGRSEDIGSPYQLPREARRCMRYEPVLDDDGDPVLTDVDGEPKPLERRCARWSLAASHFCMYHNGGSAAVLSKAKERLMAAADSAVGMLVHLSLDETVSPADRIKALNSVLDRAGVRPGVEVEVGMKGWERVLKGLMNDGMEDPPDS